METGILITLPDKDPTGSGSVVSDVGSATGYSYNSQNMTTTIYGVAFDSAGNAYSSTACCSTGDAKELLRVVPANTSFTNSTAYIGGLNGGHGLTLDGAGNQWVAGYFPMTGVPGTVPYASGNGTYGLVEAYWNGTAFVALSPAGTAPVTPNTCTSSGSAAECPTGGGFQKASLLASSDIAVDPSGNVWAPNSGFYDTGSGTYLGNGIPAYVYYGMGITEVVGAAVPVVTPFSVGAKNGTLSTKP